MLRISCFFVPFVSSMLLIGCSGGQSDGKVQQAGAFLLSVNTTPNPPEVGSSAEVVATIKADNQPGSHCKVEFRQFMPEMDMSGDKTIYTMVQEGASGVYKARSGEFSMGGAWVLEFSLACDGKAQTVKFPYNLEWPE